MFAALWTIVDCVWTCTAGCLYSVCCFICCLPCRGSWAYPRSNIDLINLKTPNKAKQTNKIKQEFMYCKSKWRRIHGEEYMLCVTTSNNILKNANREEDMLCVTASLIAKKICCVSLRASWRRYAVYHCVPHEEDMLCITACLMKKICCVSLRASWRRYAVYHWVPHEEDMLCVTASLIVKKV